MFVKLCGFTRVEDIDFVKNLPVSSVGFIFHKKSGRYITPRKAGELSRILKGSGIKATGVFVDDLPESIMETSAVAELDIVQVYDNDTADKLSLIMPVIRCARIGAQENTLLPEPPAGGMVLFDTYSADAHGGTGKCFNHEIIETYPFRDRMIIAGGINETNIKNIITRIRPGGVDISSGIEISAGIKSREKILNIMKLIKEAEDEFNA